MLLPSATSSTADLTLLVVRARLAGRTLGPVGVAVSSLALALVALVPRRSWRIGRLAVTAVHEAGHAAVALLAGRRVTAVHLRADASGLTVHRGSFGKAGRLATAAAGYPAPGIVGALGAWLIADREPALWLMFLAGLGATLALLWVRNLFGVALMVGWVAGLGWLLAAGTAGTETLVGATMAWYLAIGGLRAVVELFGAPGPSDATELGRLVHLPATVCTAGFLVVSLGSVAVCGGVFLSGR